MKRRQFLTNVGATAVAATLFNNSFAKGLAGGTTLGRVVVVGGGMAGTSVAKFLKLWGKGTVSVTLVEPNASYISNIFSNMVLTGERTLNQLTFNYTTLASKYNVKIKNLSVTVIDPVGKKVNLSDGTSLPYDFLVLAPGIDFELLPITGSAINQAKIVHAWKAGTQTTTLANEIQSMKKSDTFILTIPPKPYRCPPGPYERACVVADYLKRVKGGGKVIVLDANPGIQAEPVNFGNAFNGIYKNIITYVPNALLNNINANKMTVDTSAGIFSGQVINAIPVHKAGNLITQSGIGLANSLDGRWAVVDVLSYQSTAISNIYVVGDSSSSTQPKAGHIANAEAKVCADAILKSLNGAAINASPITNSACFTPITNTTASWLSVVYRYDPVTKTMIPTGNGVTESNGATAGNYDDMLKWFDTLMADTFA